MISYSDLPKEILLHILSFLTEVKNLGRVARASKLWLQITAVDSIWKKVYSDSLAEVNCFLQKQNQVINPLNVHTYLSLFFHRATSANSKNFKEKVRILCLFKTIQTLVSDERETLDEYKKRFLDSKTQLLKPWPCRSGEGSCLEGFLANPLSTLLAVEKKAFLIEQCYQNLSRAQQFKLNPVHLALDLDYSTQIDGSPQLLQHFITLKPGYLEGRHQLKDKTIIEKCPLEFSVENQLGTEVFSYLANKYKEFYPKNWDSKRNKLLEITTIIKKTSCNYDFAEFKKIESLLTSSSSLLEKKRFSFLSLRSA